MASKNKKKIEIKQGHCPNCGSDELNYDRPDWRDNAVDFPFICLDCNFSGSENYTMEFQGYETENRNFYEVGSIVKIGEVGKNNDK